MTGNKSTDSSNVTKKKKRVVKAVSIICIILLSAIVFNQLYPLGSLPLPSQIVVYYEGNEHYITPDSIDYYSIYMAVNARLVVSMNVAPLRVTDMNIQHFKEQETTIEFLYDKSKEIRFIQLPTTIISAKDVRRTLFPLTGQESELMFFADESNKYRSGPFGPLGNAEPLLSNVRRIIHLLSK